MESDSGCESGLMVLHPALGGKLLWSEGGERQQEGDFNLQPWHPKLLFKKATSLYKQKNLVHIKGQTNWNLLKMEGKVHTLTTRVIV